MSIDQAYSVPRAEAPCDLFLDGNEGALLDGAFVQEAVSSACFTLNRYPDDTSLSSFLAARWGLDVANVLVTAGGDDALDRLCRITLSEGTSLILPTPGFEMVSRYAQLAGGDVLRVAWSDAFPVAAIVAATTADTRAIVCTSPNNPTGAVLSSGELHALRDQTPGVLLIVDLAYAEFADEDLTAVALAMEDTVVVRTVSKAWGLAGLRVGYVLGPARWIQRLRVAGAPYAVSRLSLAVAEQALRTQRMAMKRYVSRVRDEREQLFVTLRSLGMRPRRSQGNFEVRSIQC